MYQKNQNRTRIQLPSAGSHSHAIFQKKAPITPRIFPKKGADYATHFSKKRRRLRNAFFRKRAPIAQCDTSDLFSMKFTPNRRAMYGAQHIVWAIVLHTIYFIGHSDHHFDGSRTGHPVLRAIHAPTILHAIRSMRRQLVNREQYLRARANHIADERNTDTASNTLTMYCSH